MLLPPYDPNLMIEPLSDQEIAGVPGAEDRGCKDIDPVIFSVVYARLEGILSEMTETILTTARNPILYGAKDFTCTVMSPRAEVLSMHDCLPVHVGTMDPALRFLIRAFGEDIHEGDVFVNNAPYAGNAHVGDWTMFAPIFHDGVLVAWAANKCHLLDMGAHIPGSTDAGAKDIYEEAMHFPGVRLCKNHEPIKDLIRFLGYNIRYPEHWHGDFLAQLGSLWTAEKRIKDLCDRFSVDTVKGCFSEALNYGERKMIETIKMLPETSIEVSMTGEVFEDFFPDGVPLKLKLSIKPDEGLIEFDYTDMPDQKEFGYNLTYATARCSALQGTLPILDPDIPTNDGALKRISVKLREGSVAGIPRWPVGTSLATIALCDEVTNLVLKAWAEILPEHAMAGMGEYNAANFVGAGVSEQGEGYVHAFYLAASGGGATSNHDGLPHMFGACIMGNMGYESIEQVEMARPFYVREVCAIADSGGVGTFRGAVGVRHRIQPRHHVLNINYGGSGHTCPAFGIGEGSAGSVADHWVEKASTGEKIMGLKNSGVTDIQADQVWVADTGGGGGNGDPKRRDIDAVINDVHDGFVTCEAAERVYGVSLKVADGKHLLDELKTKKLRGEK
ncbi:MAG: hydantoinase B/oxoprolinase family protein [Gammaproteobacteria bacterium]|nr:hydantoinase B/oxoprolinase family protein [Gammaproteobacteria bacterium]